MNSQQLDPIAELQRRFGVARPEDLTVVQASQLIDAIRQRSNGIAHQEEASYVGFANEFRGE
jgi:hypothetical protein